jgi:hypothetical protein
MYIHSPVKLPEIVCETRGILEHALVCIRQIIMCRYVINYFKNSIFKSINAIWHEGSNYDLLHLIWVLIKFKLKKPMQPWLLA